MDVVENDIFGGRIDIAVADGLGSKGDADELSGPGRGSFCVEFCRDWPCLDTIVIVQSHYA